MLRSMGETVEAAASLQRQHLLPQPHSLGSSHYHLCTPRHTLQRSLQSWHRSVLAHQGGNKRAVTASLSAAQLADHAVRACGMIGQAASCAACRS